jgi:hypothetical protein
MSFVSYGVLHPPPLPPPPRPQANNRGPKKLPPPKIIKTQLFLPTNFGNFQLFLLCANAHSYVLVLKPPCLENTGPSKGAKTTKHRTVRYLEHVVG